jgi:putative SOS response-associated peptidase YedK
MCNRYRLSPGDWDKLMEQGVVPPWAPDESWPVPRNPFEAVDIVPKYPAPVLRRADRALKFDTMRWGFPHTVPGKSGKPIAKSVTNVRNYASPFWRSALKSPERRCLVPASSFSEYGQERDADGKLPLYWFDVLERPVFMLAGVWRPTEADPVFALLTTEPNELVKPIHPKAMPVILHEEDWNRWLDAPVENALSLAVPFPSQLMRMDADNE